VPRKFRQTLPTYDANGNTTTKTDSTGTTTYTWDYDNRLTSATLPGSGGSVSYTYDPFGRRIKKISPTATSIFAYDGDNLVETVNAGGGVVARYSQGPNIDEPLAMLRGTATDYYEADGLGSVSSLTDATGALAQTYTYDSFGNTTASTGTLRNYFQYTGREFDTETNLYFYRARYYDQQAGRFLSEDPIGFAGGVVDFYAYVAANPTNWIDPWGLLTPEQLAKLLQTARNWANSSVPYVYGGKTKNGADCSGSVYGIYNEAGLPYPYVPSNGFATSPYFTRESGGPQPGDVGVYPGHVVIYDPNAGPGRNVWSASHTGGPVFGAGNTSWYSGTPTWYTYTPPNSQSVPPSHSGSSSSSPCGCS
jgi:RHS repeat-associated protein